MSTPTEKKQKEDLVKVSWEMEFYYKIKQTDINELSNKIKATNNKELIDFYSEIEKRFKIITISNPPIIDELSPCGV